MRRLKYERVFGLGARLGELLGEFALASRLFAGTEMVIPVPIHTSRMRHRSFNQSELLAAPVAAALQAELAATMVRWRRTPPQVGLQADQREQNVAGAFRVQGSVSGAKVLLIDDVYTSGFTLIECAKTLNQAGATAVAALTLCREV